MADTTFVPGTVIASTWLNDVNTVTYDAMSDLTGTVDRSAVGKLADYPSVKDFGAMGDGVTDDTAAFVAAAAAASFIEVPKDMVCKVDAGLDYWKFFGAGNVFEPGQQWDINPFPQVGNVVRNYRTRTFGNYENAVGMTFSINSANAQTRANTQILGTSTSGMASTYNDRDHVGMYGQSWSYEPDVTSGSTTYTATTLVDSTVATLIASDTLKAGMLIDTQHATPFTGRIMSWTGSTITVDSWYLRGTGVAGTPANSTGAIINPNTKIWGHNTNVFLSGNATNNQAQKGTGFELGLACDATTSGVNVWGFDVITLGGKPEMHYTSRGSRTYGWYGRTGADYCYVSDTCTVGFESRDSATYAYSAVVAGTQRWAVGVTGSVEKDYRTLRVVSALGPILDTDNFLLINTTSNVTLPSPVGRLGRVFTCKALVNATIATAASTIDGGATKSIAANSSLHFISDNSFWYSF